MSVSGPLRFGIVLFFLLFLFSLPLDTLGHQPISLKKYKTNTLSVPNPMVISELPIGKMYQVNDAHFVLQFYIDQRTLYGVIIKKDKEYSIAARWCFFRSCEQSAYDYTSVISKAYEPPFDLQFFRTQLPPQLRYQFQGLEFKSFN